MNVRPFLSLPPYDSGRVFQSNMNSLDAAREYTLFEYERSDCISSVHWARDWHIPLLKCFRASINPTAHAAPVITVLINDCIDQAVKAAKAGSSGEEAYRVLVAELGRELDTRMHDAAL